MLLAIAWLFLEGFVLLSHDVDGSATTREKSSASGIDKHRQSRLIKENDKIPGWFNAFAGIFGMMFIVLIPYVNQVYTVNSVLSLADVFPMMFLGIATSLGLAWFLDRMGFNGHILKYFVLWGCNAFLWVLLLSSYTFDMLGTLFIRYLIGFILGMIFVNLWSYQWPMVLARERRGRDIVQIALIGGLFIILHSIKWVLDRKSWSLFSYLALTVIGISLLTGILLLARAVIQAKIKKHDTSSTSI